MAELAGLVQRLEVAVGRLESMSGSGGGAGDSAGGGNDQYHYGIIPLIMNKMSGDGVSYY